MKSVRANNGNTVMLGFSFFYDRKVFYFYGTQNASQGPAPYVAF